MTLETACHLPEYLVIAAVMSSRVAADRVFAEVSPDAFDDATAKAVFLELRDGHRDAKRSDDIHEGVEWLRRWGVPKKPGQTWLDALIAELSRRADMRRMALIGEDIRKAATDPKMTMEQFEALIRDKLKLDQDRAEEAILKLRKDVASG